MKSINSSFNGLASSLLLNLGLSTIAEKIDPMQKQASYATTLNAAEPCMACEPCYFMPESSR